MDIDYIILSNEKDYIQNGDKYLIFKQFTLKEYFDIDIKLMTIITTQILTNEQAKYIENEMQMALSMLFENPEDADNFTQDHFTELKSYMHELDLKHQGFTEAQINELMRKANAKKKDKYQIGALFMLFKMAETMGWTHEYMLNMDKRLFFRYYGYWYQGQLREADAYKEQNRQSSHNDSMSKLRAQAGR